ncbi:hypothetical protein M569_12502, partial [Genlisea aurea]
AEKHRHNVRRILAVDLRFPSSPVVSEEAKNLISLQLLVKETSKRLSLEKILKHPWIIENADPMAI